MKGLFRWLFIPALVIALLLIACGGEEDALPSPEDGTAPAKTAVVTQDDGTTAKQLASLGELDSFRYSITMHMEVPDMEGELFQGLADMLSNVEMAGAYVAPDKFEMQMTLGADGQQMGAIIIGDRAWSRFGEEWTESPEGAADIDLFSPEDITSSIIDEEALAGVEGKKEEMNGVDTLHYTLTEENLGGLTTLFGADLQEGDLPEKMTMDLWLSEAGYPVRVTVDAEGTDEEGREIRIELDMSITDINDPDIEVEPPEM